MTTRDEQVRSQLRQKPRRWLITGVAGFIGSNLLQHLLELHQTVVGLDNFSTGTRANLEWVRQSVASEDWARFSLLEGDIVELATCRQACQGIDIVLHQAALGSVPRSIEDPAATNAANVTGFLQMLIAARDARVDRFIYAISSSMYGDNEYLPKVEDRLGRPLSPYAVSKYVNALYANVFSHLYGIKTIGLLYFNVFGRYQDQDSPYAAVIPRFIHSVLSNRPPTIYGDGQTSRDFCHVDNIVQANLLAAMTENPQALDQIYNIACGRQTTLVELFEIIVEVASVHVSFPVAQLKPQYEPFRPGDVRHSLADIAKARQLLGYAPEIDLKEGLRRLVPWGIAHWSQTHE